MMNESKECLAILRRQKAIDIMFHNIQSVLPNLYEKIHSKKKKMELFFQYLQNKNITITTDFIKFHETYKILLTMCEHSKVLYGRLADMPSLKSEEFVHKCNRANKYVDMIQTQLENNVDEIQHYVQESKVNRTEIKKEKENSKKRKVECL